MTIKLEKARERLLRDSEVRAEYDALAEGYKLIRALVRARIEANMTQADVAREMGTRQPAIARWESGAARPKLTSLARYAEVTGKALEIRLVERKPHTR